MAGGVECMCVLLLITAGGVSVLMPLSRPVCRVKRLVLSVAVYLHNNSKKD